MTTDLFVTQEQYDDLIEKLIVKVHESNFKFDTILCLARGGVRVGDIFSRVYDMPLAILAASSYREDGGKKQSNLDIATFITKTGGDIAGKLLLVDDMIDTGVTAVHIIEMLKKSYPAVTEIKSAVLWLKGHAVYTPDYYVEYLEDNPWIHQPFERYDGMGIENLLKLSNKDKK